MDSQLTFSMDFLPPEGDLATKLYIHIIHTYKINEQKQHFGIAIAIGMATGIAIGIAIGRGGGGGGGPFLID